jgi:bifunctional non-homologous end joining protein LigD
VLVSWAVPKGPSLRPADRRLAVRVPDHALAHAGFEGATPGGGGVIVWDRGTWQPRGDAAAMLGAGKLSFELFGEKLRGGWHLVRTRPRGKQEAWLLFKARDGEAGDADVVVDPPRSVVTGRTLAELTCDAVPAASPAAGATLPPRPRR